MKDSKYCETTTTNHLIGCILKDPSVLENTGSYFFREEDFTTELQQVVFQAAYNLIQLGSTEVTPIALENYLQDKPNAYGIYQSKNGSKLVSEMIDQADTSNFEYYYSRTKKMTLLRSYEKMGMNLDWLYDPDCIDDNKKVERQSKHLDNMTLQQIADEIDERLREVRFSFVDNSEGDAELMGDGLSDLIESFNDEPAVGYPMYGPLVNEVFRGARLGKFYLRSAATGVGNVICRR